MARDIDSLTLDDFDALTDAEVMALPPDARQRLIERFETLLDGYEVEVDHTRRRSEAECHRLRREIDRLDQATAALDQAEATGQQARITAGMAEVLKLQTKAATKSGTVPPPPPDPYADLLPPAREPWNSPDTLAAFWRQQEKMDRREQGRQRLDVAVRWLTEIIANKPLASVTTADIIQFRKALEASPSNAVKRLKTESIVEATKLNDARPEPYPRMEANTANGYLNKISSYFRWAVREGFAHRNPAEGISVEAVATKHVAQHRDAFTSEELTKVFSAPIYLGVAKYGATTRAGKGANMYEHGPLTMRDHHYFWVPLLGLYTGARLNEICQMDAADIRDHNGMPHFHFTDESEGRPRKADETGKKMKSKNARRAVPVHPELVRIGFMDYLAGLDPEGKLWPELKPSAGYYSNTFSKWFNDPRRFLARVLGEKVEGLVFHSFRHGFQQAMDRADWRESTQVKLFGHGADEETAKITSDVRRRYRHMLPDERESRLIGQIGYPGLDLSHLYPK